MRQKKSKRFKVSKVTLADENEEGNMMKNEGGHRVERFSEKSQKENGNICMERNSTNRLKRMQPGCHLDPSLLRPILQTKILAVLCYTWTSDLQKYEITNECCFKPLNFDYLL